MFLSLVYNFNNFLKGRISVKTEERIDVKLIYSCIQIYNL